MYFVLFLSIVTNECTKVIAWYNIVYNFEICKVNFFIFVSETDLFKLLLFKF